jgi:hypothetical protein
MMDILAKVFQRSPEPEFVKIMTKEVWIYWRLCLMLRRQMCGFDEMIDELDTWLEGASGFLQPKIELLRTETLERHKINSLPKIPSKKKAKAKKGIQQ